MKLKKLLPLIIDIIISIITLIIYIVKFDIEVLVFIEILVGPILFLGLYLIDKFSIIKIPLVITYILLSHIVIALNLGSILKFYDLIDCFDLIAHAYFGFVCSALIFTIMLRLDGDKLNLHILLIMILFIVLGIGGIWEIIEFTSDNILGLDSQRVNESISLGHSGVWDTMMDLIITIPGILLFIIIMEIDNFKGKKIYNFFVE